MKKKKKKNLRKGLSCVSEDLLKFEKNLELLDTLYVLNGCVLVHRSSGNEFESLLE